MRITQRRLARLLIGLALAGVAPMAAAEDFSVPCHDDLERLCGDAGPSQAVKRQCLSQQLESLSDGCKAVIGEAQQKRAEAGEACGDDAARLCAGVQPGRYNTGMLNCLRANAASLSDACRDSLDALPGKKRDAAASPGD